MNHLRASVGMLMAAGALTVVACEGPMGPAGPAGTQGAAGGQGAAGTQGATGATGPAGTAGAAGEKGPAGDAGAGGGIVSLLTCAGSFDTVYFYSYEYVLMGSGDVIVKGHISKDNASRQITASDTQIYKGGSATGTVLVDVDGYGTDNGGYFTIALNATSDGVVITVKQDPDKVATFTSVAADCDAF